MHIYTQTYISQMYIHIHICIYICEYMCIYLSSTKSSSDYNGQPGSRSLHVVPIPEAGERANRSLAEDQEGRKFNHTLLHVINT